jgi:hypothetical protein
VANVTHRTTEDKIYDGSTGQQIDTQTNHQIGIEVEGIFVPFLTKQGGYVDALVARGQADQQAARAAQQTQSTTDTGTSSSTATNAPQGSAPVSPPDEHPAQAQ